MLWPFIAGFCFIVAMIAIALLWIATYCDEDVDLEVPESLDQTAELRASNRQLVADKAALEEKLVEMRDRVEELEREKRQIFPELTELRLFARYAERFTERRKTKREVNADTTEVRT